MFERYTELARRVLFFARYEASQLGSLSIETEHLLLGLIREGTGLSSRIFARSFHVFCVTRSSGISTSRSHVKTAIRRRSSSSCAETRRARR
jgi:ATP-dependent Clp protease ATP-binding subunit ClpC